MRYSLKALAIRQFSIWGCGIAGGRSIVGNGCVTHQIASRGSRSQFVRCIHRLLPEAAVPPPLIDRSCLDRLTVDLGRDGVKQQTERFSVDLSVRLSEISAAIAVRDFGKASAAAHNLDNAAAQLGFARLAQLLADIDRRAQNRAVAADIVAEALTVGRRTAEIVRLLLEG